MEEINSEDTMTTDFSIECSYNINRNECPSLEENMEQLELDDSQISETLSFRCTSISQEKTIISSPRHSATNRRYSLRPQKRPKTTDCDKFAASPAKRSHTGQRKNVYLETIFENPIYKEGSLLFLGKKKLNRSISFNNFVTKAKLRHRKLKIKRLSRANTKKSGRPKVTVDDVRLKLKFLDESNDDDIECVGMTD